MLWQFPFYLFMYISLAFCDDVIPQDIVYWCFCFTALIRVIDPNIVHLH